MSYIFLFVGLIIGLLLYFKVADHFNIIDKPNERSSHRQTTIRGGGMIFPIAITIWFIVNQFKCPYFFLGLVLISSISFWDDVFTLKPIQRITIHFLAVSLLLWEMDFIIFHWWLWVIAYIFILGWINAFNFMDGINGITSFYALVSLATCYYLNIQDPFADMELIRYAMIALLVFSWFNARKKALTFAGDVGAVSIAFVLAYLIIALILKAQSWSYILFFSVYGIDSSITIFQRLLRRENIFKPHRSHLYQYLANEKGYGHIPVAVACALIQGIINVLVILYFPVDHRFAWLTTLLILLMMAIIYWFYKMSLLANLKRSTVE